MDESSPSAEEALATLCEMYWYPLYAHLRDRGNPPDRAQDLTQAFFVHVLDRDKRVLRNADASRGRFRSYLLKSLQNFVANEYERSRTLKRGGAIDLLSLDFETAEGRLQLEPPTDETPERVFDRRWGIALLEGALDRLHDQMIDDDKGTLFEHLKEHLTGEDSSVSYAQVGVRLGMSEGAVKQAVHRLRKRLGDVVRDEAARTVLSPDEIEDELRYLWKSVGR